MSSFGDIFKLAREYGPAMLFMSIYFEKCLEDDKFDEQEIQNAVNALRFWYDIELSPQQVVNLFDIIATLRGKPLEIKL